MSRKQDFSLQAGRRNARTIRAWRQLQLPQLTTHDPHATAPTMRLQSRLLPSSKFNLGCFVPSNHLAFQRPLNLSTRINAFLRPESVCSTQRFARSFPLTAHKFLHADQSRLSAPHRTVSTSASHSFTFSALRKQFAQTVSLAPWRRN